MRCLLISPGGGKSRIELLGALCALLFLVEGCCGCHQSDGPGRMTLSSWVGGREIKASIEGSAAISSREGVAIVAFPGHQATVEKERVILDDKEIAKVPSTATKVELNYSGGLLTVIADGKEISRTRL